MEENADAARQAMWRIDLNGTQKRRTMPSQESGGTCGKLTLQVRGGREDDAGDVLDLDPVDPDDLLEEISSFSKHGVR